MSKCKFPIFLYLSSFSFSHTHFLNFPLSTSLFSQAFSSLSISSYTIFVCLLPPVYLSHRHDCSVNMPARLQNSAEERKKFPPTIEIVHLRRHIGFNVVCRVQCLSAFFLGTSCAFVCVYECHCKHAADLYISITLVRWKTLLDGYIGEWSSCLSVSCKGSIIHALEPHSDANGPLGHGVFTLLLMDELLWHIHREMTSFTRLL